MFDRFTERARRVLSLARQEAQSLSHDYIGTEHILIGLAQEGTGAAAQVLAHHGIDPRTLRQEVEKIVARGTTVVAAAQLPFTPLAKKVLEFALAESQQLGHGYIGTEHLLLGVAGVTKGVAAQALVRLGKPPAAIRATTVEFLGADPDLEHQAPRSPSPSPSPTADSVRVLRAADEESERRRHRFVGTEHLLVGIVAGEDAAARLLHESGVTASAVRLAVDSLRATGDAEARPNAPQYSDSAARALDRAWDEATALGHPRIDPRHLALALLAVREGLAANVLHRLVAAPESLIERLRALPPAV
jgi:ATP-dependent Clp protease ATP-binding subunit ClpA